MIRIQFSHPRRGLLTMLTAVSLALSFTVTGCGDTSDDNLLAPGTSTFAVSMTPPTLEEVQVAVSLTAGQTAQVEPPLTRWREAHVEETSFHRRDRSAGDPEMGPGQGGPKRFGSREPLLMAFLEDCAGALTDEQFADLVDFLAERQARFLENREAGMGHRLRAGGGSRFGNHFDLDEETAGELRDARKAVHEALRSARKDYVDGNATASDVRDRATDAVDGFKATLQDILSDEQYTALASKMSEQASSMAGRRLENLDHSIERRITFLTKVLGLDEGQSAELASSMAGLRPSWEALFQGIQSGEMSFPDALYEGLLIKEAGRESLQSILTEGQQERLAALRGLLPGPRRLHLYL